MLGVMMLAAALPLVASAWLPTDNQTQLMISLCAVIAIALAKPFAEAMPVRLFIITVAGVIVMRYWMWRVTTTLPDTSNIPAFVIGVMLFAVETYSVVYFFLTSMMMSDPIDHELPPHVAPADLPTVTVLIPSYNEPTDMLRITVAAACNMLYPSDKLQVVLCDDGGTDQKCNDENPLKALAAQQRRSELMQLCHELGASYSTRSKNIDAKAGNMRAAMASTESDLIVVFDADHVPSSDFLARTVGYFKNDPKLFLVQTPHFFLNDDPVHRNLQLPLNCPPENEMFYSKIHRGLDRWGGAFFCGSAAVLRRRALDDVGGFSGDTITEDAETALEIHSRGWRSMYLNQAMIAGLQPETFSSFIQQRGRWAAGMMQLFVMKNPIMRGGLKFAQKVCYFNSMTYWFFPIIRGIFMVAPLVYLFFGLEIFVADFQSALSYTTGYLAVSLLVQNTLFSRDRWPLVSEIYEVAQTPYLLRAVLGAIFNPKSFSFKVTDKSETVDRDYISPIYGPLLATLGLMGAGWAALAVR
ncbi:MAG: cellulose synthase catalytic subunit (UDP-forming), partial [Rhodobacteraceae bacterium]|nr:cellulose synthase catalytic subunit (UDP-forming) [Paracoccaceae bacterium]